MTTIIFACLFIFSISLVFLYKGFANLSGRLDKVESITINTYKNYHTSVLTSNRERESDCCDSKFVRDTKGGKRPKDCAPFTTKERKEAGFVTRTEAKD